MIKGKTAWTDNGIVIGSTTKGKGIFATMPIKRGKCVLLFSGVTLTFNESLELGDDQCYSLQVDANEYLHLDGLGRYVNHSCEPNCGIKDGPMLVALRDISAGEEITFDYSTTMLERCWEMACECGSPSCRGVVRDFDLIPVSTQIQYINKEIVSRFILELLASGDWEDRVKESQAA